MSAKLSVSGSETLLSLAMSQGRPAALGRSSVMAKGKPRSLSAILPTCFLEVELSCSGFVSFSGLVSASLSDVFSSSVGFSLSVSSSLIGRVST